MLRRKDSLRALAAERVGQGEMGGVTRRVLCTWWLLTWQVAKLGFEKGRGLVSGKKCCLVSERVYGNR